MCVHACAFECAIALGGRSEDGVKESVLSYYLVLLGIEPRSSSLHPLE